MMTWQVGLDVSRTAIALLRAAPEYERDRVYAAVFDIGGGGGGGGGGCGGGDGRGYEARAFVRDAEGSADVVKCVV
jgi:hypothetical protein